MSFQMRIARISPTTLRAGFSSGTTIWRMYRMYGQPSIAAASSSSDGMLLMKPVMMKIGRAIRLDQSRM